jgi:sugar O-acyltransferase (sialic acid O-acetyltransferase NeuD family)
MDSNMRVVVLGGGGHGAVVTEAAIAAGYIVEGFYDDARDQVLFDHPHLGLIHHAFSRRLAIVLGVGSPDLRRAWLKRAQSAGLCAPTIVHPRAWVAPSARLKSGCVVMAGAVIQARTAIHEGAIVNTGASVDHDCRIDAFAHIAPGARLAGGVHVGEDAFIGMMSCVIEGLMIGNGACVAAGAAVVRPVAPGERVAGVPARTMRTMMTITPDRSDHTT